VNDSYIAVGLTFWTNSSTLAPSSDADDNWDNGTW
jgi:hypothetical protein